MNSNPMLKRLTENGDRGEFFHTSRYAKVQNGSNMGAASTEGFSQRMAVDGNRRRVKKYSDSKIAMQARMSGAGAKTYDAKAFKAAREERFGGGKS